MALPTSNLPVISILQTLGVSDAKSIFYNSNGIIKTIEEFGALVRKDGLDTAYCPGVTADDRLLYLITHRNLRYFKGYEHVAPVQYYISATNTNLVFPYTGGIVNIVISSSHAWTTDKNTTWAAPSPSTGAAGDTSVRFRLLSNTGSERYAWVDFIINATYKVRVNIMQEANYQ